MQIYLRVLECARSTPTCSVMALLSHRVGWWLAGLISLFPSVFCASTSENPGATYRTESSEVRISFFATDENDRLLENLKPDDFAVVDDGIVVRDFRSFSRANETPLDVVVLVDASESVTRSFHRTIGAVRLLMQQSSLPSDGRISVVIFAGLQSTVLCATDCASASAIRRLDFLKPDGATPLYDALVRVGTDLSERQKPDQRQLLILFSDANDTISRASPRDALDGLMRTGAVLYGVNLTSIDNSRLYSTSLEQMAEAMGGRVLSETDTDLLPTILAEQRASYVVTYDLPSRVPGHHPVRILPKRNLNLRFHCRRGYYYEEARH
jgi:VWFA-related protein